MLFAIPAFGQEQIISGLNITNETSWSGKIIIEGDVIVNKNARLKISPGTQVLFRANIDKTNSGKDKTRSELIVKGILIAQGRVDRKITFSSASNKPRMGDWYGIQLINSKQPSIIDYSLVEYAYNGITVKKNNSVIRNSQIGLNYNAGISCEVKAKPTISKNIISENGYAGIITSLGAEPVLSFNLISQNEIGIIVFKTSLPNLGNLQKGKNYNLGQNNIFENTEYDLYNHSDNQLIAENNSWGAENNIENHIFGPVDVQPFYKQQNIDALFQIAQEAQSKPIAENTEIQQQAVPDKQAASTSLQNNTPDKQVENKPLLTANNPAVPLVTENNSNSSSAEKEDEKEKDNEKRIVPDPIVNVNTERALATTETKSIQPQIDYNQVFMEPFLDSRKAEIVKKVSPKRNFFGKKGRVIVRTVVDRNGNVESASVVKGIDENADNLSKEAAMQFKFKPGTVKGVPVKFSRNISFIWQ